MDGLFGAVVRTLNRNACRLANNGQIAGFLNDALYA